MSSERDMRKKVVKALRPLHAVSIENGCGCGTPDVNYADGWLELKAIEKWPARENTIVKVDHFTPDQRLWLRKRHEAGGTVFLLLKTGPEWLLFYGIDAAEYVGKVPRSDLERIAIAHWPRFHDRSLLEHIVLCSKKI